MFPGLNKTKQGIAAFNWTLTLERNAVEYILITQASRYKCVFENHYSCFSAATYAVGTQKNCLNETVFFS